MNEPLTPGTRDGAGAGRRLAVNGGLFVLAVGILVGLLAATGVVGPPRTDRSASRLSDVLSPTIETQGIKAALAQYRRLRELGFPGARESESDTNSLGYRLLGRGDSAGAIQVFQLNVETHPGSANVYDSLGEAYVAAGNTSLAIDNYRKAVAIAPRKGSVRALQKLTHTEVPYRPLVLFHVIAGSLGLLAGAAAMTLRKGSRGHAAAGNVFVVAMLSLSGTGAYMAFVAPNGEVVNVLMGVLTFYLVATAWLTARRRNGGTGLVDRAALVVVLAVAAGLLRYGVEAASSETGSKGGAPAPVFFVFGAVALLAAGLDIRMIRGGGVFGPRRIARHLWRMCSALFIAVTSLFLGQPQVFPDALRNTGLLALPGLLVLLLLIFWLVRVLFTGAYKRTASPRPRGWRTPREVQSHDATIA